jgi:hypothetical protein
VIVWLCVLLWFVCIASGAFTSAKPSDMMAELQVILCYVCGWKIVLI